MSYSPTLMRWLQADPTGAEYVDGPNLYLMERGDSIDNLDPTGLAAWKHTMWWDDSWKKKYRDFVQSHAAGYMGRTEDCADLAMTMLVDFASDNGLPVTFRVQDGRLLVSKSCQWSTKQQFSDYAKRKIGAQAIFDQNTGANVAGCGWANIQPGDMLISTHHAAIVVNVMKDGELSAGQVRGPGGVQAKPGIRVWDAAAAEAAPNDLNWIYNPTSTAGDRVDYLNHTGSKNRQKAEMKYNRPVNDLLADGFEFRFWNDIVFSNYKTWDGTTKLSSE